MSSPQWSLAHRFIRAFNERDETAVRELVTDDVEIHPLRAVLEDIVYRGRDGLREWFADVTETWKGLRIELVSVDSHPAGVEFVEGRIAGSGQESSAPTQARAYFVVWLDGERARKLVTFTDEQKARAAFGAALIEPDAIRAGIDAFMEVDRASLAAWQALGAEWWTDDIEMVEDPRWPGAGEFHGRDAVAARFQEYFQSFEGGAVELEAVHGSGDDLVLDLLIRAQGSGSGVPVAQPWAWRVRFREGRLAMIRPHLDRAEARAAAGLDAD